MSGYDLTQVSDNKLEIVNAAITVDDVDTGESHVVLINQAVHVPTMEHNLLCPMRMRMHGAIVNDTPNFLLCTPTNNDHCVLLRNGTLNETLRILLTIKGVSSVVPSQKTTKLEYQKSELFIATSNSPLWYPHVVMFGSQESALTKNASRLQKSGDASDRRFITTVQMGSNNLADHSFQSASVLTDTNEM